MDYCLLTALEVGTLVTLIGTDEKRIIPLIK